MNDSDRGSVCPQGTSPVPAGRAARGRGGWDLVPPGYRDRKITRTVPPVVPFAPHAISSSESRSGSRGSGSPRKNEAPCGRGPGAKGAAARLRQAPVQERKATASAGRRVGPLGGGGSHH